MTVLKGIFLLPARLLLELPLASTVAALLACFGCGLAWWWLFSECALSTLPTATEGLSLLGSGAQADRSISHLLMPLPLSTGLSSHLCHWSGLLGSSSSAPSPCWAPPPLHHPPAGLLPFCTIPQLGSSHFVPPHRHKSVTRVTDWEGSNVCIFLVFSVIAY